MGNSFVFWKAVLGSSTNVKRIISSLTDAGLIDTTQNGVVIADPVMEIWLKGI